MAARRTGGGRLRLCPELGTGLPQTGGGGAAAEAAAAAAIPAGLLRHFVYHVPARRQYLAPALLPWPGQPPTAAQVIIISCCDPYFAKCIQSSNIYYPYISSCRRPELLFGLQCSQDSKRS